MKMFVGYLISFIEMNAVWNFGVLALMDEWS